MATFEELMEQFRNPGDNGVPENFAEELTATYEGELSVRDAAIQERQRQLDDEVKARQERDAEVTRLKAVNYDLLMAAPKPGNGDDNKGPDDDASQGGVDSLFDRKTL